MKRKKRLIKLPKKMGVLIGMGSAGYVQKAVYKPNNFEVAIKVFFCFL